MKKGDVVLVDFPFTDLSQTKRRPALVLAADANDVTLAFITSRLYQAQPGDVQLTPTAQNGLRVPSAVRVSKLATLARLLVHGRLGDLPTADLVAVDAGLMLALSITVPA